MSNLDTALQAIPYLQTLGIRTKHAQSGQAVLQLPFQTTNAAHGGAMHTGTLFTVGELTATIAAATHPGFGFLVQLLKCSKIKYTQPAFSTITAMADVTDAMVSKVKQDLTNGEASLEIPVSMFDTNHKPVAEMMVLFVFRPNH
ncbi:MAG: DUF4442 domain-containing protein [Proteobacteria bacterium]|jgi:acyl-coenzyme A thioesterase PaaI-like protein|nr:DUF4442 domain-containing protein [Pseudomonadota bacterium]